MLRMGEPETAAIDGCVKARITDQETRAVLRPKRGKPR
jgi:hypothetical protein